MPSPVVAVYQPDSYFPPLPLWPSLSVSVKHVRCASIPLLLFLRNDGINCIPKRVLDEQKGPRCINKHIVKKKKKKPYVAY